MCYKGERDKAPDVNGNFLNIYVVPYINWSDPILCMQLMCVCDMSSRSPIHCSTLIKFIILQYTGDTKCLIKHAVPYRKLYLAI